MRIEYGGRPLGFIDYSCDEHSSKEGDNTVLLQLVAKGLLTGYRDAFGSLDSWGKVGFVADLVRETVLERTAARGLIQRLVDAVPNRDDDVPMMSRGWQLKMFEDREKHVLEGVIRRLRKKTGRPGADPFDAFNDVQDHLLRTAQAHIDRVVLEASRGPGRAVGFFMTTKGPCTAFFSAESEITTAAHCVGSAIGASAGRTGAAGNPLGRTRGV